MKVPNTFLAVTDRILSSITKPPSFESIAITQLSTASVSFVASTVMAITIAWTGNGLSIPYRRIIFGLSISDVAQSLGLIVGPFAVPSDTPNCWGVGNTTTCRAAAFIYLNGSTAVPIYTCFACWYYLCKLKYRMSDREFTQKTEIKIHVFIILFVLILMSVALQLNTFHPAPAKVSCEFAAVPLGCRYFHDFVGECDATITTHVDRFAKLLQFHRAACILGMICMMSMILWHAVKQARIFKSRPPDDRRTATIPSQSQQRVSYLSSLYQNEIVIQTICYVAAFCLTYIPQSVLFITVLVGGKPSGSLIKLVRYLMPLGGLFNILTYSRPQVASLHRACPDRSWFLCFWLVLRAGGDMPEHPFSDNEDDDQHRQQERRPRYSFSSVSPFGVIDHDSIEVFDGSDLSLSEGDLNFNPFENWSYVRGGSLDHAHDKKLPPLHDAENIGLPMNEHDKKLPPCQDL